MRVPYRWLSELVDIPWPAAELAERLTMAGVKVEAVHDERLGLEQVVAGRILAVAPHPQAEGLLVATVDAGGAPLQIVSGAPNTVPGGVVAVARPGARLPGGWCIEATPVRGVLSQGMLLSATELLYGEPHAEGEGLLELDPALTAGSDLGRALDLDDVVLELDLTPNYGHCLSMLGVAQEVAALARGQVRLPPGAVESQKLPERQWPTRIEIADPTLCSRYVGKLVRAVRVAASPLWVQRRLQLAGMRPINNVVDVTNYVMLELGQPLHAFDYRLLSGPAITVRPAGTGERMVTLDGKERVIPAGALVIADDRGAVAVAGVMGGLDTEVTAATSEVLLESAHFNPVSIRRTAAALGLRSEASARFERGIDPTGQARAAERAANLLQTLAGARPQPGAADRWPVRPGPRTVSLRVPRLNALLGTNLGSVEVSDLLRRLGFGVTPGRAGVEVRVPPRRVDVAIEADLIEEVARLYGYNRIPATLPRTTTAGHRTRRQELERRVRTLLLSCGVDEAITMSLVRPDAVDRLGLDPEDRRRRVVTITNPLSEDQSVMRSLLVPGLLEALAYNRRRQQPGARFFELGRVYASRGEDVLPHEQLHLGLAAYGPASPPHWRERPAAVDFYYAKGVAETLWRWLGLSALTVASGREPWLHPYRQAALLMDGVAVGWAGELHPRVAANYELPPGTVAMEVDLDVLLDAAPGPAGYLPLPRYPAASRDLAVVVPEEVSAGAVLEVICRAGGELLESVRLFDVYHGEQVPQGHRSLAYALTYRSPTATLNDAEVEARQSAISRALADELGARLR